MTDIWHFRLKLFLAYHFQSRYTGTMITRLSDILLSGDLTDLPLITTIAMAFVAAWVLGLITQRLRLSPIVGYLLAGVAIGPHTPGFVGNIQLAHQLSEIGVMLLMFGVGLHFHLDDLLAVRKVAIPGAITQSIVATVLGMAVAMMFGLSMKAGIVLGMAVAVASTVVLMRVLADNKMMDTIHGHVAVGWLIVEDILTVIVLVLIPALGSGGGTGSIWVTLPVALLKLSAMVIILLWGGGRVIPWIMVRVARLRSRELFTLTVLVMAIAIATGSAYAFGASMALGAFLAGMVVGRSPVSQQAAADALPLRDAFAVLFFTSVGMIFDPKIIVQSPGLVAGILLVILIGKPLAAMVVVAVIGYSARTALTVAIGLAQIGEFSFILSELGRKNNLLDETGHNVVVACAIISITINPLLMRWIDPIENAIKAWPWMWRLLNRKVLANQLSANAHVADKLQNTEGKLAVIVGYGPVGQTVDRVLMESGLQTVIIDLNMDTIQNLTRQGRTAIYGDAYNTEILHQVMPRATYLIITLPHATSRNPLILAARQIQPEVKIFVRARYMSERDEIERSGATAACYEEAEASVALAQMVLGDTGADSAVINRETIRIRKDFKTPLFS